MAEETDSTPQPTWRAPSNSTTLGALGGASLTPIIIWALGLAHVAMPPEVAASAGAILGNLIGYFFEGGRKTG